MLKITTTQAYVMGKLTAKMVLMKEVTSACRYLEQTNNLINNCHAQVYFYEAVTYFGLTVSFFSITLCSLCSYRSTLSKIFTRHKHIEEKTYHRNEVSCFSNFQYFPFAYRASLTTSHPLLLLICLLPVTLLLHLLLHPQQLFPLYQNPSPLYQLRHLLHQSLLLLLTLALYLRTTLQNRTSQSSAHH